jgi:hypothetical protein
MAPGTQELLRPRPRLQSSITSGGSCYYNQILKRTIKFAFLFSDDKPDRFFTVIKFWMDATSGVALDLKTGVPSYQVEDEEGRTHLLIYLAIEERHEHRWGLWRPDRAGFDSRSIFEGATVKESKKFGNYWERLILFRSLPLLASYAQKICAAFVLGSRSNASVR